MRDNQYFGYDTDQPFRQGPPPDTIQEPPAQKPGLLQRRWVQFTAATVAGVGTLVAAGAIGFFVSEIIDGDARNTTSVAAAATGSYSAPSTTASLPPRTITPSDFTLDVTVVSKKCFGSAGCHVKYTIDPTYTGLLSDDLDGRQFTVVYEVSGGDDSQIGHFKLNGTAVRKPETVSISTPSSDSVIAADVTNVIENG